MTIKNITLSLVATSLLATAGFAAVIEPGSVETFATELASLGPIKDVNATKPIIFQCQMNNTQVSVANNAGVQLTIPGYVSGGGDLAVFKVDYNTTTKTVTNVDKKIASFSSKVGKDMLVFKGDSNTSISQSSYYMIANKETNSTKDLNATALRFSIPKDSPGVQAKVQVVSNNGVNVLDSGSAPIAKAEQQFNYSVVQPTTAQIDASNSFYTFTGSSNLYRVRLYNETWTQTTDNFDAKFTNLANVASIGVKYVDNSDIDYHIPVASLKSVISPDQNLSGIFKASTNVANVMGTHLFTNPLKDINATTMIPALAADHNATLTTTFTDISTTKGVIPVTNFTASAWVTTTNGKHLQIANQLKAGQWTIYGYNAQIPNVSATSNTMTVFKFTNRGSLTANVYFTLIDPQGTVVTLNSKDFPVKIPAIKSNETNKYFASTLAALAKVKNPNFDDKGSFSVEVTIPANPSSIYGMASFKNNTLGQFKMLPVYNNSKLNY